MIANNSSNPPGMDYGTGRLGLMPETEVVETMGRLIEFWGFKRALGRVWACLYLSPVPLCAAEIGETLCLPSGALTDALDELQLWGVVFRVHKPAGRKECFAADEDIWKLVARVLSDRELREVESAYDTFARAEQACPLGERGQTVRRIAGANNRGSDFRRERIAQLRKAAGSGKALLQGLILTRGARGEGRAGD